MYRIAIALISLTTSAFSAWDVSQHVSPLTDKTYMVAQSRSSVGTNIFLHVMCVNNQLYARVTFPARVPFRSPVGTVWRLDDGPTVMRNAWVSGNDIHPWTHSDALSVLKASRVRVQVSELGTLDFDTRDAPKFKCS